VRVVAATAVAVGEIFLVEILDCGFTHFFPLLLLLAPRSATLPVADAQ